MGKVGESSEVYQESFEYDSDLERELSVFEECPTRREVVKDKLDKDPDCLVFADETPLQHLEAKLISRKKIVKVMHMNSYIDDDNSVCRKYPLFGPTMRKSRTVLVIQWSLMPNWKMSKDDTKFYKRHRLRQDFVDIQEKCRMQFPQANLILNEFLPMYFRVDSETKRCEELRLLLNETLSKLCKEYMITLVRHSNFDKADFYDGVHLSRRRGVRKYVY